MSKCLVAEYENYADARIGLEVLEKCGFTMDQVSVVSRASDPASKHLQALQTDEPPSSSGSAADGRNASLGMLIGGTVAAPIAAGTMIGPFIIAGPLVGMAIGAAVGSLLNMESWGVTRDVSVDYEQRVQAGSVLVIVHDVEEFQLTDAELSLKTTGPKSLEQHA